MRNGELKSEVADVTLQMLDDDDLAWEFDAKNTLICF